MTARAFPRSFLLRVPLAIFALLLCVAPVRADWTFVRGDTNGDGVLGLIDVIDALGIILNSEPTLCPDVIDANDDGVLGIVDVVTTLEFLIVGTSPLPAPYPECGVDPTPDALVCFGPVISCEPNLPPPLFGVTVPAQSGGLVIGPSGDLDGDGILDVLVGESGLSSTAFRRGLGGGQFDTLSVETGSPGGLTRLVDVDGDGDLDLVAARRIPPVLTVSRNDGSGGFTNDPDIALTVEPWNLLAGDLDGDGTRDLVVAARSSASFEVVLSSPAGGYSNPFLVGAGQPIDAPSLGDVDGDGILDLVAESVFGGFVVLSGTGTGSFLAGVSAGCLCPMPHLRLGDVDGDSDLDIVAIEWNASAELAVRRNDGNGVFTLDHLGPIPSLPIDELYLGDVDGDGTVEGAIFTRDFFDRELLILEFDSGGVPSVVDVISAGNLLGVNLLDVTGDQVPEAVFRGGFGDPSMYILNDGAGLESAENLAEFSEPRAVAIGELDGDGELDLIVTHSTNTISRVDGASGATVSLPPAPVLASVPAVDPQLRDIDSDSVPDLFLVNAGMVEVFRGDGNGGFLVSTVLAPIGGSVFAYELASVDAGATIDVAAISADTITVFLNAGGTSFVLGVPSSLSGAGPVVMSPQDLTLADFNGDGDTDYVCANGSTEDLSVGLGDGSGAFGAAARIAVGTSLGVIASADLDSDGDFDLVAGVNAPGVDLTIRVYRNDGNANFSLAGAYGGGREVSDLELGDLDGDGIIDIVTSSGIENLLHVRFGQGDGTFAISQIVVVGPEVQEFDLIDFDGDGDLDVVYAQQGNAQRVRALINRLNP